MRATLGPLPCIPTHPITQSSVNECEAVPVPRCAEDSCEPGNDRPDRTVKQASAHKVVTTRGACTRSYRSGECRKSARILPFPYRKTVILGQYVVYSY